jgi:hypothetical protein
LNLEELNEEITEQRNNFFKLPLYSFYLDFAALKENKLPSIRNSFLYVRIGKEENLDRNKKFNISETN